MTIRRRGERGALGSPLLVERVLGRIRGGESGPALICIGGIHGNEPAGVLALERVVHDLRALEPGMKGDFVALAGNRAALARGSRFLDADLNRLWTGRRIRDLERGDRAWTPTAREESELEELFQAYRSAVDAARGPAFTLDLHTTSGGDDAFSTVEDRPESRAFALRLPVPMVLGLARQLAGTFVGFATARGHTAIGFEGGQHVDPESVERIESALWIAIAATGLLPESRIPRLEEARARLMRGTNGYPRIMELRYRHPIREEDGFRMRPGLRNFQPIEKGDVLGRDCGGEVRTPETGRLLMPLYQRQGEEGFFVVRSRHPSWFDVPGSRPGIFPPEQGKRHA